MEQTQTFSPGHCVLDGLVVHCRKHEHSHTSSHGLLLPFQIQLFDRSWYTQRPCPMNYRKDVVYRVLYVLRRAFDRQADPCATIYVSTTVL